MARKLFLRLSGLIQRSRRQALSNSTTTTPPTTPESSQGSTRNIKDFSSKERESMFKKMMIVQSTLKVIVTANMCVGKGDKPSSLMCERLQVISGMFPKTNFSFDEPTEENTTAQDS